MIEVGYQGAMYPINPKGGEALGHKILTSIEEVEGNVDVAVIAIPARFVYDAVVSCAKKNVKFLSIISSGFSKANFSCCILNATF